MKLEELKNKINEMYELYGDVDVHLDFKTGDQYVYAYAKHGKIQEYAEDDIKPEMLFDEIFIEDIADVSETLGDDNKVNGILISNFYIDEKEEENA